MNSRDRGVAPNGGIVQAGLNRHSRATNRAAMKFIRSGRLGDVYRGKAIIHKGRASIGHAREASTPEGVHWDLYLGPAPYRAFNINRFHYGWHFFFWDTSTTDIGNSGVHNLDMIRCGMFPRALSGLSPRGVFTQGSASLHPWATILRRFAAQKSFSDVY